jgi:hypothetical protein
VVPDESAPAAADIAGDTEVELAEAASSSPVPAATDSTPQIEGSAEGPALVVEEPESAVAQADDPAETLPAAGAVLPVAEPEGADPGPVLPEVRTFEPVESPLPEVDTGVRVNRPQGETATDATGPADVQPEDGAAEAAESGPALERFAAPFTNLEGKPVMSVILIDDGTLDGAAAALAQLPFPVTVAVDPALASAGALMESYRSAGIELMALARLPRGAIPTDVEVTYEAVFAAMPDAIGVLDAGEGGLQSSSALTDQAMLRLATDGRGVVTTSVGLNMAARAAASAGVAAAVIERDLDGEGQDPAAIRRALDQATFRARQESGVVLLGRVQADTISALMLWGSENGAGQVAIAPVSAVLLAAP